MDDEPMTMLAVGSMALTAVGTGISATGTLASGSASQQAGLMAASSDLNAGVITATAQQQGGEIAERIAEVQAKQLDQNAGTTRAQAQRQAFDLKTQTRLALSTLQARASGSGLSATGSTPIAIARSIGARGAYLSLTAMANGENTARGLEDQAYATRMSGAAAKYGGELAAYGTIKGAQSSAQADIFKGNAAKTGSEYAAWGTLASGTGTALSNFGKVMYPTPTGRPGV